MHQAQHNQVLKFKISERMQLNLKEMSGLHASKNHMDICNYGIFYCRRMGFYLQIISSDFGRKFRLEKGSGLKDMNNTYATSFAKLVSGRQ